MRLSPLPENRFVVLLERLDTIAARADELAAAKAPPRLAFLGESVRWIRHNLATVSR